MEKQKLTLLPNQFVIFSPGLKMENVGDVTITFELPEQVVYHRPEFTDIRIHRPTPESV